MKRIVLILTAILAAAIAIACNSQAPSDTSNNTGPTAPAGSSARSFPTAPPTEKTAAHTHGASVSDVPAFQTDVASLKTLRPTLPPEKFSGKTSAAYRVVKEIPQTIAQLPCYCHCDKGYGHKSLYSCYEDDHAAHCAVCVDEALLALRLEKVEKLNPDQIRERIIAQYSSH